MDWPAHGEPVWAFQTAACTRPVPKSLAYDTANKQHGFTLSLNTPLRSTRPARMKKDPLQPMAVWGSQRVCPRGKQTLGPEG
jgi:hypothetical protein